MFVARRPAQAFTTLSPHILSCDAYAYEPAQVGLSRPESAVLVRLGRNSIPVQALSIRHCGPHKDGCRAARSALGTTSIRIGCLLPVRRCQSFALVPTLRLSACSLHMQASPRDHPTDILHRRHPIPPRLSVSAAQACHPKRCATA
ncbi:hypothetical protein L1887_40549 [Cichorium endivia]|nr:hypothetical protein L1887_40549 [Cichorium endivia]